MRIATRELGDALESKPKKINCQELLDSLADYLDEDAQAELCRNIEEHLNACHDCQVYVDTVKKTSVRQSKFWKSGLASK